MFKMESLNEIVPAAAPASKWSAADCVFDSLDAILVIIRCVSLQEALYPISLYQILVYVRLRHHISPRKGSLMHDTRRVGDEVELRKRLN
jgi:hypothetical protein